MITRNCETCGKEFQDFPCKIEKGRRFCSWNCRPKADVTKRRSYAGENNPHWRGGKGTIRSDGYRIVKASDHPRATKEYVLEHWLVAEKALGKPLPPKAVVHHVNNIGHDNGNSNLVICENQGYHALLHMRQNLKQGKIIRDAKGRLVRPL